MAHHLRQSTGGGQIRGPGAGLSSAAFVGIVPSYISRSVAGSYDNEGVAIFALMFVFFFYVKVWNLLPPPSPSLLQFPHVLAHE